MKMNFLCVVAIIALFGAPKAWGSGCGSYDHFREVLETRSSDPRWSKAPKFEVITVDSRNAVVHLDDSSKPVTLQFQWKEHAKVDLNQNPQLSVHDVSFTEGHGCGPVYNCVTGQYRLRIPSADKNSASIYAFPTIGRFHSRDDRGDMVWRSDSLIPTFHGLKAKGDPKMVSGKPQCLWGDW